MKPSQYLRELQNQSYQQSKSNSQRSKHMNKFKKISLTRNSVQRVSVNKPQLHQYSLQHKGKKVISQFSRRNSKRSYSKISDEKNRKQIVTKSQLQQEYSFKDKIKIKQKSIKLPKIRLKRESILRNKHKNIKPTDSQKIVKQLKNNHTLLFDSLHNLLSKNTKKQPLFKSISQSQIQANKKRIRQMSKKYKLNPNQHQFSLDNVKNTINSPYTLSQWHRLSLGSKTISTEPTNFDKQINQVCKLYQKSNNTLELSFEGNQRLLQLSIIMNQRHLKTLQPYDHVNSI